MRKRSHTYHHVGIKNKRAGGDSCQELFEKHFFPLFILGFSVLHPDVVWGSEKKRGVSILQFGRKPCEACYDRGSTFWPNYFLTDEDPQLRSYPTIVTLDPMRILLYLNNPWVLAHTFSDGRVVGGIMKLVN